MILKKELSLILAILLSVCSLWATNVKDYGAKGNGTHDDTQAVYDAISACDDGQILFPAGRYRLTRTISIDLTKNGPLGITGTGGTATVLMDAPGPAFRVIGTHNGTALPSTVSEKVWLRERMFTLENLEIAGEDPLADGIELQLLMQPTIRGCLIRNLRHGILLTKRNRNVLLEGNHIYRCSGVGIYLDSVNIHQIIISHSHISYCDEAGIKIRQGEIHNFQITGNDIEYNCNPESGLQSSEICIDLSKGGNVREGTISGNTLQAIESPGGANIRFTGNPAHPRKLGLWSITGNHISNQEDGIYLENTQGISITGNTFIRAYDRHLRIENSSNIVFTGNVIDHNADYFTAGVAARGGITITDSKYIMLHDNIIDGISRPAQEREAALEIIGSTDVSVKNNMLLKVRNRPVEISDSPYTLLEGNTISMFDKSSAVVSIRGRSEGSFVTGNRIPGLKINNRARRVTIRKNQSRER